MVAKVALAFGMHVIAWSQNLTADRAAAVGASLVTKEELLRQADFVSIHLVLSARTKGLIGAAELALMKPSARLVNTSRGPIVDEAALIDALTAGRIAGAAIDVYDVEPLPAQHPTASWKTCWQLRTSATWCAGYTKFSTAIRWPTSWRGWTRGNEVELY